MMNSIHDIVFNALARRRVRRFVMLGVYRSYAVSILTSPACIHGFTVTVLGGSLMQLITPSAIWKNLMSVRLGDIPYHVVQILMNAPIIKTVVLASFTILALLAIRRLLNITTLWTPTLRRA